jgi:hypothetical protein
MIGTWKEAVGEGLTINTRNFSQNNQWRSSGWGGRGGASGKDAKINILNEKTFSARNKF